MTERRGFPSVDHAWLNSALSTLAEMVDPHRPLYTRRSFSETYKRARVWLQQQFREAGLAVSIDAAANVIGRLEGRRPNAPAIVLGSHTDTVPAGGRFDGTLGVLSALAVARALQSAGYRLAHPLEIVDFLAEEPSEYGVSCVGSRALAGMLTPAMMDSRNSAGETLREGIRRMGGRPEEILEGRPLRNPADLAAFIELHIEQGPKLETAGVPVGVVTGIVGIGRSRIRMIGREDHAGTMPMELRRDALVGAAEIIRLVNALARQRRSGLVATVGRVEVHPNAANVVPGLVEFELEVRSLDQIEMDSFQEELLGAARRVARENGLEIEIEDLTEAGPTPCSPLVRDVLREAVTRRGLPVVELPSGAGHDTVYMTHLCPAGMLFVRCKDGRSHTPDEWVDPEDVAVAAEVFLEAVLQLDDRLAAR